MPKRKSGCPAKRDTTAKIEEGREQMLPAFFLFNSLYCYSRLEILERILVKGNNILARFLPRSRGGNNLWLLCLGRR